jgi:hypothetical protein
LVPILIGTPFSKISRVVNCTRLEALGACKSAGTEKGSGNSE